MVTSASLAILSIHSAPPRVVSKSSRTLCGIGHIDWPIGSWRRGRFGMAWQSAASAMNRARPEAVLRRTPTVLTSVGTSSAL
jgi:hypothetical protein